MGGCFSSEVPLIADSANVVAATGELRQFPLPITAAQVVKTLTSSAADSFFLCHSDRLYFNDYIPSLLPDDELEPDQIYFVLPAAKLKYPLAASDMAALAVKASSAIEQINASNRRRKSKTRISPVSASEEDPQSNHTVNYRKSFVVVDKKSTSPSPAGQGVSRSGSVRKLTRYSSKRAKLAVRSFRLKLTTIYEGSVLHPNF